MVVGTNDFILGDDSVMTVEKGNRYLPGLENLAKTGGEVSPSIGPRWLQQQSSGNLKGVRGMSLFARLGVVIEICEECSLHVPNLDLGQCRLVC